MLPKAWGKKKIKASFREKFTLVENWSWNTENLEKKQHYNEFCEPGCLNKYTHTLLRACDRVQQVEHMRSMQKVQYNQCSTNMIP